MTYTCSRCGAKNRIVNQCGCDPQNLPTRPTALKMAVQFTLSWEQATVALARYLHVEGTGAWGLNTAEAVKSAIQESLRAEGEVVFGATCAEANRAAAEELLHRFWNTLD